jgi:Na+/melibiose symporter-like transporter
VVFPILANLGSVLRISAVTVGLILSANRLVRLVADVSAGVPVDRYGTQTSFDIGSGA